MTHHLPHDDPAAATAMFQAWAGTSLPATLTADPHPNYANRDYDVEVEFPDVHLVSAPKLIDGGWARLWNKKRQPLDWYGENGPGPSDPQMIDWRRLWLQGAGMRLRNANVANIEATVENAGFGLLALNHNDGGQSEGNRARLRIMNCGEGVRIGPGWGETAGNPSHRDWQIDALITGTDKPFRVVAGASVYGGTFRLRISAKPDTTIPVVDLDGFVHGAHFDILIENPAQTGIVLENPRKDGWHNEGNQQGFIRAHFVHAVQNPGIFDGPMAELPPYRFTYGNGHNQNHTRPAWQCADGDVFDTYLPPT